jgi:hypothetical protein
MSTYFGKRKGTLTEQTKLAHATSHTAMLYSVLKNKNYFETFTDTEVYTLSLPSSPFLPQTSASPHNCNFIRDH